MQIKTHQTCNLKKIHSLHCHNNINNNYNHNNSNSNSFPHPNKINHLPNNNLAKQNKVNCNVKQKI